MNAPNDFSQVTFIAQNRNSTVPYKNKYTYSITLFRISQHKEQVFNHRKVYRKTAAYIIFRCIF